MIELWLTAGAVGAAGVGFAVLRHLRHPERWWSRGEWPRLVAIRGKSPVAIHWRAVGLLGLGRPQEAIAEILTLETRRCAPVLFLNSLVEALVTAGRYREAVERTARHPFAGDAWLPHERVLVLINAAEAFYNQGRWDRALALLEPLDSAAAQDPLTRSALALQRSWIYAALGRQTDAGKELARIVREDLAESYWPEVHFARAVAAMTAGDFAAASAEVDRAEACALRASTRRNVLFLRGRLLAARGELDEAEQALAAGAAHPFRFQGGDGLLLWGEVLSRLGRQAEARHAWELAIERDPESEDARRAGARIALDSRA